MKNAAKDEEKKSFVASFKVNHVDIGVATDQWRSRRIDVPREQPLSLMNGIYTVYIFYQDRLLTVRPFVFRVSRSFEDRLLLTLSIRVVHSGVTFSKKFLYVFILISLVIFSQTRCYYSDSGDVPRKQLEYYPQISKRSQFKDSSSLWCTVSSVGELFRAKDLEIE